MLFSKEENQLLEENIIIGSDKIKIETGEEFNISYEIVGFPNKIVSYKISDKNMREATEYYIKSGSYKRPEIKLILKNSKLNVYKVTDKVLIYQLEKYNFKSINLYLIGNSRDVFDYSELFFDKEIEAVAKVVFLEKNWEGILFFADYIMAIENNQTEQHILEGYASKKFTKEEIIKNKNNKELQNKIYIKSKELIEYKKRLDRVKKGFKILIDEMEIINKENSYFSIKYSAEISLIADEIVNEREHMFEIAVFNKDAIEHYRYYIELDKSKIIKIEKK